MSALAVANDVKNITMLKNAVDGEVLNALPNSQWCHINNNNWPGSKLPNAEHRCFALPGPPEGGKERNLLRSVFSWKTAALIIDDTCRKASSLAYANIFSLQLGPDLRGSWHDCPLLQLCSD